MSVLDRVARTAADVQADDERRITRRELAGRGLLALLALGTSRLGVPAVAFGASKPCTSLAACLKHAERAAVDEFWKCQAKYGTDSDVPQSEWLIQSLDCRLWTYQPAVREAQRKCLETCPPPKGSGPRKKPPRRAPTPPPPLPPNPYWTISSECANCASVGGKCCYGRDPAHLCACGHPDPAYDCAARYGCG